MSNQPPFAGFPKETLQFLKDLAANNNREWFKAHEEDYRRILLTPAQDFVIALGERMKAISKRISYDPQTNGRGSIMRIYRDIRFSKDKSPYNTNLRMIFWEGGLKKTENPGYYFSMDANEAVLYSGMHMFSKELLETYRQAVLDPDLGKDLEAALEAVKQAGKFEVGGETYKRVPAGYPSDHVRAPYLLYTGLYALSPKIAAQTLTSPDLVEICFDHARKMSPIHQWLVRLISLPAV